MGGPSGCVGGLRSKGKSVLFFKKITKQRVQYIEACIFSISHCIAFYYLKDLTTINPHLKVKCVLNINQFL